MPRIRADNIGRHKTQTREAILDAAKESFGRFGYDGTSLSVVSDLSELPRSSLYAYFPNKDALLLALVVERVAPLVETWLDDLPSEPPAARVEAMFSSAFAMAAEHPVYASLMLEATRRLPKDTQRSHLPQLVHVMEDLIGTCAQAISDGSFVEADPAALADVLGALLVTGVEAVVSDPEPHAAVPEKLSMRLQLVRHGAAGGAAHTSQAQRTGNRGLGGIRSVPVTAG